ncbi:MAG: putative aminopeptidase YsdC [Anaerolineales bacterium]|nr:putative aminopeptidase YsdC [Anaerolineales bacterium]
MPPLTISSPQIKLLEKLCNAVAVSGDEGEVRKIVLEQVTPHADEVRVDALGNVLVTKRGAGKNRLKVLLASHMDEIGFMVVEEARDGFYRFEGVGGVDASAAAGQRVLIGKSHIPAVIGIQPIHLLDEEELQRKIKLSQLRFDTGAAGAEVNVGDYATYATRFRRAGNSMFAKAIDDRIGVATLIELLKHAPKNIDLLLAFTTQEEVGLRGAGAAAYALVPDLAIAIDSTPARDLPNPNGENVTYNSRLGLGPAIYVANATMIDDARLVRHFEETARKARIPYQIRQPGGGGTDAGAIHQQHKGIPSLSISVPGRYAHTPVGHCRVDDWQNTLRLLHAGLSKITPAVLKR